MEREYEFTIRLTRQEYDAMVDELRRINPRSGNWATWLRSELMDQMKAMGENPEPPKYPDYAGHAAETMIDFWSDVHREASESLGMTPDVAHRAFDAITVLALEEFPWTTMGGHQTRAVLYALRDAGLRIVEVDHTAPARTAGTETGGMK